MGVGRRIASLRAASATLRVGSAALGAISLSYTILFGSYGKFVLNQKDQEDGRTKPQQIDEAIAHGLASGRSEEEITKEVMGLSRMSDEELAEMGIYPPEPPSAVTPAPLVRLAGMDEPPQRAAGAARRAGEGRPTGGKADRIDVTAARDVAPPVAQSLDFTPAPVRHRHDGWTAERQRAFIAALAETGCVSEACAEVGITARSAYRLREHPAGAPFRAAWDHAQSLASVRLTAIAWERAVHGTPDRIYKDGKLIAERRKPSDKLLMWLLAHHNPVAYGWAAKPPGHAPDMSFFPVRYARTELPGCIADFIDVPPADCPAEAVPPSDYYDADETPDA